MAAKNVQAWSQATKNYVGIYRQAKQLDAQQGDASQGAQINVMFVGQLPKSAPRNVTPDTQSEAQAKPAIDVASTPAK